MRRLLLSLVLLTAFAIPALSFLTGSARAEEFTRAQIEDIVREFIQKNPKVMIDSVEEYSKQQQTEDDKAASQKVIENSDWLFKNPKHAEAGNPKGDITIVEFFDYNCGYCKSAMADLMTILDEDKKLRVVFIEIPILGDSSFSAARWALAANKQKMYLEYHIALMRHKGPLNDDSFLDLAKKAGLDLDKLKTDRADPSLNEIIDENLNMARKLGIQGTPAFVIGDQLIRGYVGVDGLKEAVAAARAAKK